jgi:diguanylate cyclase (GGDEF)-like protein
MEGFLSPSGVAVITPALWLVAGFSLATGVHFISVSLFRRSDLLYLAFGLTCLAIFFNATFLEQTFHTATSEQAVSHHRLRLGATLAFFGLFAWFVALYTRHPRPRRVAFIASVVFGTLFVINAVSTYPLGFSETTVSAVRLPWGESVNRVHGPLLPWAPFAFSAAYAVILWAAWRSVVEFRRGERAASGWLAAFLLILLAAVVYRQIAAEEDIAIIPVIDFAFIALVAIMSTRLALMLRHRAETTEATVALLRAEMEKRRDAETRLQRMAYFDLLTELPNRAMLTERLHDELALNRERNEHGALLLFDLDHFKTINDALGHNVGDELLKQVGIRLRQEIGGKDLAVRMGGDEFAVLLTGLPRDLEQASAKARQCGERLTASLTNPIRIGDRELHVGLSIGISVFRGEDADEVDIVRRSDLALYRAKMAGRNLIHMFTSRLQADVDERLEIERGLRAALDKNEFSLHFQPQVDGTGRMIGVEALLRWRRGEREDLLPSRFVPIAEETGLIHSVGDWVLNEACTRINAWRDAKVPTPPRLSVNVSAWQIARVGFAQQVLAALQRHRTDPKHLILEITESAVLADPDVAVTNMTELAKSGIEFSIDDFGSGFASLAYLRKLPLQYLKIDRQFIQDVLTENRKQLAQSIIAIGQAFGLRVIAEGVETELQRQALAKMGCDGFQGFLICPPLPESGFIEWATTPK